ncbi:hypothetical protein HDU87_000662 [Geranomyces variabilis]|uniref:Homeobox domain-containing protein n=1 Tax=Geranomyces variabilis TaxID=109894 RepID=A0AAD5TE88_9FUNG|nr:hypothetical protein HDU87_000662 [Geranomyces variabilis]
MAHDSGDAAPAAVSPAAEPPAASPPADPAATAADPWNALAASLGVPLADPAPPVKVTTAIRLPANSTALPTIFTIPPLLDHNDDSKIRTWNLATPTNFSHRISTITTGMTRTKKQPADLAMLKSSFAANPRPSSSERARLVNQTSLSLREIDVWFMNRRKRVRLRRQRRARRDKQERAEGESESESEDEDADEHDFEGSKEYDEMESEDEDEEVANDNPEVKDELVVVIDDDDENGSGQAQHAFDDVPKSRKKLLEETDDDAELPKAKKRRVNASKTQLAKPAAAQLPLRARVLDTNSGPPPFPNPHIGVAAATEPNPLGLQMIMRHLMLQHDFMLRQIAMSSPDSILRPPPPLPPPVLTNQQNLAAMGLVLPPGVSSHHNLAAMALINLSHQPQVARGGLMQNPPTTRMSQ